MAFRPPGKPTVTSTMPLGWAPVRAVKKPGSRTVTAVAGVPPRVTVAGAENPLPVIVTAVPPAAEPPLGLMEVTVGGR